MSRYKCEYCEEINTSKDWNEATIASFGADSFTLEECEYDAIFICPSCHTTCTDKLMTKLIEEEYLCIAKTTTNHIIRKIVMADCSEEAISNFKNYLTSNFTAYLFIDIIKLSEIERI